MNQATVWPENGADRRAVEALRIQSCHLDQKMPESEGVLVLFLFILHKAPSLALFSCNGCATLRKGPKTQPLYIMIFPLPFYIAYEKAILRVIIEIRENKLGESSYGTKKEPLATAVFKCC